MTSAKKKHNSKTDDIIFTTWNMDTDMSVHTTITEGSAMLLFYKAKYIHCRHRPRLILYEC